MIETLLKIHRDSEEVDFKEIWRSGIFVFDSNVLLDLYRLPEIATKDLIDVLSNEQFNSRVWIGFQGLLEFLNNRHETISDQKNKFTTVKKLLNESIGQYDSIFENLKNELSTLKLKQRHSLIDPDKFLTLENIQGGKEFLESFIEDLSTLENKQSDVNDEDKIKASVLNIFNGKVGAGFTKKELEDIYKDGETRYENKIPPGYKDNNKTGSYKVEDREFIRKFGDLILWKEIIGMAIEKKASYIVLITGDVKEDWWIEKRGKRLGPRKELLNEIYSKAPDLKTFYMYDTSSFLKHAKSELSLNISDASIIQTKDLIENLKANTFENENIIESIYGLISDCAMGVNIKNIFVGEYIKSLPPLFIEPSVLLACVFEILVNARKHGSSDSISIKAEKLKECIEISFKNEIPIATSDNEGFNILELSNIGVYEGKTGIYMIKKSLKKYGIDTGIIQGKRNYTISLYIPMSLFLWSL
ncbi:PIN-like domain-containing protein [Morganella morganii]|nr:hypothetical protein [Morganella morganii]